MLQTQPDACSPQTLSELQRVFDTIWGELERNRSELTFPWAIETSRFTLARLVLEHLNDSKDLELIKGNVLQRLNGNSAR